MDNNERERWRDNMQNAWAALRMIREAVETLGPPGAIPSRDTVLIERGAEPIHEAGHCRHLRKLLSAGPPSLPFPKKRGYMSHLTPESRLHNGLALSRLLLSPR